MLQQQYITGNVLGKSFNSEKYNNILHILGHKYVLGQTQTHYSRSQEARGENINFITIIIPLKGIEKIKPEKMTVKQQNILINHATI